MALVFTVLKVKEKTGTLTFSITYVMNLKLAVKFKDKPLQQATAAVGLFSPWEKWLEQKQGSKLIYDHCRRVKEKGVKENTKLRWNDNDKSKLTEIRKLWIGLWQSHLSRYLKPIFDFGTLPPTYPSVIFCNSTLVPILCV